MNVSLTPDRTTREREAESGLYQTAREVVHEALGPGTHTTQAIARQFGADFLRPDGSVDRALLAAKVFGDIESHAKDNSVGCVNGVGHDEGKGVDD